MALFILSRCSSTCEYLAYAWVWLRSCAQALAPELHAIMSSTASAAAAPEAQELVSLRASALSIMAELVAGLGALQGTHQRQVYYARCGMERDYPIILPSATLRSAVESSCLACLQGVSSLRVRCLYENEEQDWHTVHRTHKVYYLPKCGMRLKRLAASKA